MGGFSTKHRHRSNPEQIVDDTFIKCLECGKLISKLEISDSKYCKDCYEVIENAKLNSLKRCAACHEFFPIKDISDSEHCVDCERKLRKCRNCGARFVPEKKEIYCPVCYSNLMKVCRICKKDFLPSKKYITYCAACSRKHERNAKNQRSANKTKTQENSFVDNELVNDRTMELLIKALQTSSTQEMAIENFIKLGESAVEPLILTFAEGKISLNHTIRDVLVKIGEPSIDPLIESLSEINVDVKINSIKTLGDIGDEKAIDPLIDALNDYDDSFVRKYAAKALTQIDNERVIEPLIEAIDDDSFYVRRSVAKSLGILGDIRAVEPLCNCLKDQNATVRISAAVSLGYINSDDSVDDLIDCLGDRNHEVVKIVENTIIKLKGEEFLEEIKISKKSNEDSNQTALNKEEFLVLIDNIFDDDPDVRVEAAQKFGDIKHEKSAEYLLKALKDSDEDVVIAAVISLGKLGFPNTIKPIISLLKCSLSVRAAAEEALIDFGSKALNIITEALEKEDEDVRYALAIVLGSIEDKMATNLLIKLIRDSDQDVKFKAIDLLGHKKDNISVPFLLKLYEEEDFETKKHIMKSLGFIGSFEVLKILDNIDEPNWKLQKLIDINKRKIASKIERDKIKEIDENLPGQEIGIQDKVSDKKIETIDEETVQSEPEIEKQLPKTRPIGKNPLDLINEIKKPLEDD